MFGLSLTTVKLAAIGAVLALLVAGTAFITHRVDEAKLQAYQLSQAKEAQAESEQALATVQQHQAAADRLVALADQAAQQRQTAINTIRRQITNAPVTKTCVSSPAVRALLDGLRNAGTASSK